MCFLESTAESNSLVVVLPLVPVICITGMFICFLWYAARDCRDFNTSSTITNLLSPSGITSGRSTTANAHPFSMACIAYRLPSKFSPFKAKNMLPSGHVRLSVVISGNCKNNSYNSSVLNEEVQTSLIDPLSARHLESTGSFLRAECDPAIGVRVRVSCVKGGKAPPVNPGCSALGDASSPSLSFAQHRNRKWERSYLL